MSPTTHNTSQQARRASANPGRVIVIFGASGNAGGGALQACLADHDVSEVRAITRRPLGVTHPKLREVSCTDFADLTDIAHELRGVDGCLFCPGTSVRNVRSEAEYRRIHVTYALAAARMLLAESPTASFIYISGAGTKRNSWLMWARVKAEAEDDLAKVGLVRQANVRPTGILPPNPKGAERWLLAALAKVIAGLTIDRMELGRAMLRLALDESWQGSRTLESPELRAQSHHGPGTSAHR